MSKGISEARAAVLRDQELDTAFIANLRETGEYGRNIAERLGPKLRASIERALVQLDEIERISNLPVKEFIVLMQARVNARNTTSKEIH
ncbi:MAG: hypothetical protein EOP83_12725 [Verrucomicrobiaceae bacterium]|nr:MAG: hypothetical protein EOP83_12725 [Verrucomicrobiaceae bacterium]